jgi:hypothetical protein
VHLVTSDLRSYNPIAAAASTAAAARGGGGGGEEEGGREQNKAQHEHYNPYIQENLSNTRKRQRPYSLKLCQWF